MVAKPGQPLSRRDIPSHGVRISAEGLRRRLTMLAQRQGGLLEVSPLGKNLTIDARTVHRYLDLLIDLMRI